MTTFKQGDRVRFDHWDTTYPTLEGAFGTVERTEYHNPSWTSVFVKFDEVHNDTPVISCSDSELTLIQGFDIQFTRAEWEAIKRVLIAQDDPWFDRAAEKIQKSLAFPVKAE